MTERIATDWDEYYHKEKSFFSNFTQRYTLDLIFKLFDEASRDTALKNVMELGGGNSCFAEEFCNKRELEKYDIIDNNKYSVELFEAKHINVPEHIGVKYDLVGEKTVIENKYDFVYSIGLIEHFNDDDRQKVIDNHFKMCREGGYVLISFPTPTFKYRFWRRVMELLNVWQFWDESPMFYKDIQEEFTKNGEVKEVIINKKLFLTQTLVLVKAN